MLSYPRIFFLVSLLVLWVAAQVGTWLRRRRPLNQGEREDFNVVEAATLTLLGLIIGFSFSMAITRYDLRKNYEEAEANAIGTEYVRAQRHGALAPELLRHPLQLIRQVAVMILERHAVHIPRAQGVERPVEAARIPQTAEHTHLVQLQIRSEEH